VAISLKVLVFLDWNEGSKALREHTPSFWVVNDILLFYFFSLLLKELVRVDYLIVI